MVHEALMTIVIIIIIIITIVMEVKAKDDVTASCDSHKTDIKRKKML